MSAILECSNLSKRFGSVNALSGVNLTIEPGRIVGLLGPNGSGKTTLIKLTNGLLTPVRGRDPHSGRAARQAVPQHGFLSAGTYQHPPVDDR